MKVYIAGSSLEIERVEGWTQRLTAAGIEVVSAWIASVKAFDAGNPRDMTPMQRMKIAHDDLRAARSADVFWFLVPPPDRATRGAWFEFGAMFEAAGARRQRLIASGDTAQSLFCALADEYLDDVGAFVSILRYAQTCALTQG